MPKITKEEMQNLQEKLDFIGLDLENLPGFLKEFEGLEFRPSKLINENEYLVYKNIPINEIEILISKTDRLTDIKEKYSSAKPICRYLNPSKEEDIENFAVFLDMLKNTSLEEIEQIEKQQEELRKNIPFRVKYEKNYLWQIYFSEYSNKYFMLVPSQDKDFGSLFYLLKQQIKYNNSKGHIPTIYVPIVNAVHDNKISKKSEMSDIENYLWLFTGEWPTIYEVTEKEKTIEIVGETEVYPNIKSNYKIKLQNKEMADRFYKHIKALFILQTEIPQYYKFVTKVNKEGSIEFYYNNDLIEYSHISTFIKEQYLKAEESIKKIRHNVKISEIKLNSLKQTATEKDKEFLMKQKEISMYLEYKKTFFGRVKYFFSKKKNISKKPKEENKEEKQEKVKEELDINLLKTDRVFYTIEDLITIYNVLLTETEKLNNIKLDINALELKIKNMTKKIENATLYINEIDSHKKSIFEFWKYSSKDDVLSLNEGEEKKEELTTSLKKAFDYKEDFEEVSIKIDKMQREKLTKEEEDSIYVANTSILNMLNMLKNMIKVNNEKVQEILDELKKESEENTATNTEYDIFGYALNDRTQIKILGNKKHRETERNKYQILNINSDANLIEFKEKLKEIYSILSKVFEKLKSPEEMSLYKIVAAQEKIDLYGYNIYNIDPEIALKQSNIEANELNMFKINVPENMPIIFYSNIIFYDNFNKTLPLGMNLSREALLNCDSFEFTLKNKTIFNTNKYFNTNEDLSKLTTKKINLYEYDLKLKG